MTLQASTSATSVTCLRRQYKLVSLDLAPSLACLTTTARGCSDCGVQKGCVQLIPEDPHKPLTSSPTPHQALESLSWPSVDIVLWPINSCFWSRDWGCYWRFLGSCILTQGRLCQSAGVQHALLKWIELDGNLCLEWDKMAPQFFVLYALLQTKNSSGRSVIRHSVSTSQCLMSDVLLCYVAALCACLGSTGGCSFQAGFHLPHLPPQSLNPLTHRLRTLPLSSQLPAMVDQRLKMLSPRAFLARAALS